MKELDKQKLPIKQCLFCGADFEAMKANKKFCSYSHAEMAHGLMKYKELAKLTPQQLALRKKLLDIYKHS